MAVGDYEALIREVHVYAYRVAQITTSRRNALRALLDDGECERLRRLRTVIRQLEYLVAHGILRERLGHYLAVEPATLRFAYAAYGKPALAAPAGTEIHFSLSHAHGQVLIALTRRRRLGVDLEYLDPHLPDPAGFAAFFTERERQELAALPPALARRGFYALWTRKEAFIKATGEGFTADLQSFSVSADPRSPPQLLVRPGTDPHWCLHDLAISPDTAAALVVSGPLDYMVCVRRGA